MTNISHVLVLHFDINYEIDIFYKPRRCIFYAVLEVYEFRLFNLVFLAFFYYCRENKMFQSSVCSARRRCTHLRPRLSRR